MPDQQPRVALYCRQSQTADGDRNSASLQIQQTELEQLAEKRGWIIAGVYVDADAPAGDLERRIRWLDLLNDADSFDLVAAYDTSRLWRSVELKVATCRLLSQSGIDTIATISGEQPTDARNDPEGGLVSTILAAVSEFDNQLRAMKSRKGRRHAAAQGRPHIGGTRAYGYDVEGKGPDAKRRVVPEEATVIREIARRLLAGESLRAVTLDLNHRRIPTSTGGPWRTGNLRHTVLRPDLAGIRVWKGEEIAEGEWEPILTRAEHDRLVVRFSNGQRAPARRRLLGAGLSICGRCGWPLVAQQRQVRGKVYRTYRCRRHTYMEACGTVAIADGPYETEVANQVCGILATTDMVDAIRAALSVDDGVRDASDQLKALAARRRNIGRLFGATGDLAAAQEALAEVETLEQQARATLDSAARGDVGMLDDVAADPHGWWERNDTPQRRALLEVVLESIVVRPVERPSGNRFDPTRLTLNWRY